MGAIDQGPTATLVARGPATIAPSGGIALRGREVRRETAAGAGSGPMLGSTRAMRELFRRLERASRAEPAVLIEGETGTGKSLAARTLHSLATQSGQSGGVFVALDPESTESWPWNVQGPGGTLFVEEVADLAGGAQRELLGLIEAAYRRPLAAGGRPAVRVVCATGRNLRAEVERGAFRADLHARLRSAVLSVPSLRDRREDLPLLAEHFLAELGRRGGRRPPRISPAAMDLLLAHGWEGNVRELRNEMERAFLLTADGEEIGPWVLSPDLRPPGVRVPGPASLRQRSRELEKQMVAQVLARHRWNVAATARELGISRVGLSKKLRTLGMKRPERGLRE